MRIERNTAGEAIQCVLSRRNLLTLLAKLDGHPPDSRCTLIAPAMYGAFSVKAEADEAHYAHASREENIGKWGPAHPETEARIQQRERTKFE